MFSAGFEYVFSSSSGFATDDCKYIESCREKLHFEERKKNTGSSNYSLILLRFKTPVSHKFLIFGYNFISLRMQENVSKENIEKWLTGWSLSRELPLPTTFKSGFKVEVGYENQKTRYVFPNLNEDFTALANTIVEPWVFLKVCAAPEALKNILPSRWVIEPQGYFMSCSQQMTGKPVSLSDGYKIESEEYKATYVIKIRANNGEIAAIGRIVVVDDIAVYDRIATDSNHKRKGLATVVMKELQKITVSKGISSNYLVATEEGKLLYQSLGWELSCLYTSVVIPG